MGRIGPRQQRFEVLPAPSWGVEDLLSAWRADRAPVEAPAQQVSAEPAVEPPADRTPVRGGHDRPGAGR